LCLAEDAGHAGDRRQARSPTAGRAIVFAMEGTLHHILKGSLKGWFLLKITQMPSNDIHKNNCLKSWKFSQLRLLLRYILLFDSQFSLTFKKSFLQEPKIVKAFISVKSSYAFHIFYEANNGVPFHNNPTCKK
jgi:hypothetical protein